MGKKKKTQGDSLVATAEVSTESLKLTADLMKVANERTVEILERQLQAEVAAHNETRRRLSQANRQLDLIRDRAAWLMGDSFPDETIDEIEEVIEGHPK